MVFESLPELYFSAVGLNDPLPAHSWVLEDWRLLTFICVVGFKLSHLNLVLCISHLNIVLCSKEIVRPPFILVSNSVGVINGDQTINHVRLLQKQRLRHIHLRKIH